MRATTTLLGFCLVFTLPSAVSFAATDEALAEFAQRQEWSKVAALVAKQVDVNAPQPDGTTALHWAAHWNDLKTAELLIGAGANVNALTRTGVSALSLACENGNAEIVVRLLDAGANANITEVGGMTPLMVAGQAGNLDAVKALIAHGATVDVATTELGQTALMWAAVEGHAPIVKLLIDNGASISTVSKRGFTPLMFAVRGGRLEVIETLVEAGADVNVETPVLPASPAGLSYQLGADPIRPLPLAIANNHAAVALYLLEKGANPNQSTGGMSALHHAVYGIGQNRASGLGGDDGSLLIGRVELVKALLKYGANPNARQTAPGIMGYGGSGTNGAFEAFGWGTNRVGATPFYLAADCSNSNPELMRILLAAGADPNLITEDGTTPLMASAGIGWGYSPPNDAARQRMLAGVKFLVEEVGADVNAANAGGFTALHAAAYKGSEHIIAYLVEHGAKMNVRDYRGRTPYRLASWARNSTDFYRWPQAAELLLKLGANPRLGVDANLQERELARATQMDASAAADAGGKQ
jgi:ankyrin repeat protein